MKKSSKKLVTVVFPVSVIANAKAVQKKHKLRTFSALLRVAVEDPSSLNFKIKEEPQCQVSFRMEEKALAVLGKLAVQHDRSVAEIVRMLVKNVGRVPAKRFAAAAALEPIPRKTAKKAARKAEKKAPAKSPAKTAKKAVAKKATAPKKRK